MLRVVAVFDDLLLGSKVLGMLRGAGHDAELVGGPERVSALGADVLVVDLGSPATDGIALVTRLREEGQLEGVKLLGVYSHVDSEARERAQDAGFDLVVPRSRMAREGAALVSRLGAGGEVEPPGEPPDPVAGG